jgi:hypothetical protein
MGPRVAPVWPPCVSYGPRVSPMGPVWPPCGPRVSPMGPRVAPVWPLWGEDDAGTVGRLPSKNVPKIGLP